MKVKAGILIEREKLIFDDIDMDAPKDNEVQIKMVASGVCGTDIMYYRNPMMLTLPAVLGHEGGGIVEEVGKNVTNVKPGDKVLIYSGYCGECEACLEGRTNGCSRSMNPFGKNMDGTYRFHYKGQDVGCLLTQGTFKERVVVDKTAVLKIDPEDDLNKYACFVCGPKSGSGAAMNTAKVMPGQSVLVIGAGTVGLAAVGGAALSSPKDLIVCDVEDSRLETAKKFGATHVFNSRKQDIIETVNQITGGLGVHTVIECTGRPEIMPIAIQVIRYGGLVTMVGDSSPNEFSLPYANMAKKNVNISFNRGPGANGVAWAPHVKKLIHYNKQGKFPIDILEQYYKFDDLQTAMDDLISHKVIKPVIQFGE